MQVRPSCLSPLAIGLELGYPQKLREQVFLCLPNCIGAFVCRLDLMDFEPMPWPSINNDSGQFLRIRGHIDTITFPFPWMVDNSFRTKDLRDVPLLPRQPNTHAQSHYRVKELHRGLHLY